MEDNLLERTQNILERMTKILDAQEKQPATIQTETGTRTARKPFSSLTFEEFSKLSIRKRNDLYEANPEKYEEMIAREKGKVF